MSKDSIEQLSSHDLSIIFECAGHNNNYCSICGSHCPRTRYSSVDSCDDAKVAFNKLRKLYEYLKSCNK